MILSQSNNINEYNTLINNLNPMGRYQIIIYAIGVVYWMIAGILKTIFDLTYYEFQCPYATALFECFGILLAGHIACWQNRKIALIAMGIISLLGYSMILITCLMISSVPSIRSFGTMGIALIGCSTYSQPLLALCIICQLTIHPYIKYLLCLNMAAFSATKILMTFYIDFIIDFAHLNPILGLTCYLLGPVVGIQIILSFIVDDSPRATIDQDFEKAQQLMKKITKINGLNEESVLGKIDDYFVLKRINIKLHNYFSLAAFQSFGISQYCMFIVLMLLGIISQCPHYVLSEGDFFTSEQIQEVWISGFQLVGIAGVAFFIRFSRRKLACLINSSIVGILNTILFFKYKESVGNDLVILGLNAVFSISLYIFLLYNAVEFYPHSVRTIGLCFIISGYYFGIFLFLTYCFIEPIASQVLQLFLSGTWILMMHTIGVRETMRKGFSYEVKQIQEQDNEQL